MARPKILSASDVPLILEFDCLGTQTRKFPSRVPGGEEFVTTKVTGSIPHFEVDETGKAYAVPAIVEFDLADGLPDVIKGKRTVLL